MRNRPLCSISLVLSVLICIGVLWGGEKFVKELRPSPAETYLSEGDIVQLLGRVYQREKRDDYQILYLKNNSMIYKQQSLKESKVIIYDGKMNQARIGDVLRVQGEVSLFQNARNPGNFDEKSYYQRRGIHIRIWANTVEKDTLYKPDLNERIKEALLQFRIRWQENLNKGLEDRDAETVSAMLLGEKSGMDADLKELYRVNGIGHILAISGLHLSLIGVGTYHLLRRACGSYIVGGMAGIFFLSLYIMMIGSTVSALRALIMFLFRVGADMTGRHYDSITALSFSALFILVKGPLSVYDGGFWMSFGAIFAIILILPAFRDLPFQSFWASVSIELVLLPVILMSFYEFPLYSVFLNLIVIPLMSLLLVFSMAGSVLCLYIPVFGNIVFAIVKGILRIYEYLCIFTIKFPMARIVTGQPETWQVVLYYVLSVGAAVLWKKRKKKKSEKRMSRWNVRHKNHLLSAGFIGIGLFVLCFRFCDIGNIKITMIDVGQGDGIFIKGSRGGTYLIDGGSSDVKKVGQYRIEPFLKSQGVKKLDYVFISHGDSDHMNGIEEMIERGDVGIEIKTLVFPVKNVWDETLEALAEKAAEKGIRIVAIKPGEKIKEGNEMQIYCLAPSENYNGEPGNAASMVLAVKYGRFDMLLTGDIEGESEEALTQTLENMDETWEVLKAAHHGSKNSTSEEFLKAMQPLNTFISAGQKNIYGHPHTEMLERIKKGGSKVYCTKDKGAITVIVKKEKYSLKEYFD